MMALLQDWNGWNQDQRELREIAHLYFSEKNPKKAPEAAGGVATLTVQTLPVLIQPVDRDAPAGLSSFLLCNVAVLLRIRSIPVTLVGVHSHIGDTLLRQGGFFHPLGGHRVGNPEEGEVFYGPMGIPVHPMDTPPFEGQITPHFEGQVVQKPHSADCKEQGSGVRAHRPGFVLTDNADWFFAYASSSSIVILLLQPRSDEECLHRISRLERSMAQRCGAGWGILLYGCSTQGQSHDSFQQWAERIRDVFRRPATYYGSLPGDLARERDFTMYCPYVLREPRTHLTRCLQEIALTLGRERDSILCRVP